MASFRPIETFTLRLIQKQHDFSVPGGDQYAIALTNDDPTTPETITELTQIPTDGIADKLLTLTVCEQFSGNSSAGFLDKTMTSSGPTGPFQYVWIYNTVGGDLVCSYDFLAPQNLVDGQNFIVDFTDANNYLFSINIS